VRHGAAAGAEFGFDVLLAPARHLNNVLLLELRHRQPEMLGEAANVVGTDLDEAGHLATEAWTFEATQRFRFAHSGSRFTGRSPIDRTAPQL
jgi:hypothetical protein